MNSSTATPTAVSIAAIGTALEMPFGIGEGYDSLGREEEGARNLNDNGLPIGIVATHEQFSRNLDFPLTPWTFVRNSWLTAWQTLKAQPFAFAWDIDGHPDEIDLVFSDGKFQATQSAGELATISLRVSGVPTIFNGVVV